MFRPSESPKSNLTLINPTGLVGGAEALPLVPTVVCVCGLSIRNVPVPFVCKIKSEFVAICVILCNFEVYFQ